MAASIKPKIIANPKRDRAFAQAAERHLSDGAETALELERRLRADWPRARVEEGIADADGIRWYVYRDGGWVTEDY